MNNDMQKNRNRASAGGADAVRNLDRERRRRKRYNRRKQQVRRQLMMLGAVILGVILVIVSCVSGKKEQKAQETVNTQNENKSAKKSKEASEKGETLEERVKRVEKQAREENYPDSIIELLSKNPETVAFVENYGEKKDISPAEQIEELKSGEIPALYQWDERWGYAPYGNGCVATSGCGPTCMSMIISGMANDPSATPAKLAAYGEENDYLDEDNNTYWSFMSESAKNWGITGYQIAADEETVSKELMTGHPIVCSVGPGDFTDNGHFIVLTAYENGEVTVHDPFSKENSEKKWVYSGIFSQIKAVWTYSKK